MTLEKSKATYQKGFHMVHCWDKLKETMLWRVGYAAYQEAVKNGTSIVVVDGEDGKLGQNALPRCPRGHKSTKANFSREASTLASSQAL
jgi:hypothetical protein